MSSNISWISNLRFLATIAVITLHTSAVLLANYGKVPLAHWFVADFFNALVRFAVPVFVMVTGALTLSKHYHLSDFLRKRLVRLITPFLFWSIVYICYSWYNGEFDFDNDTWTNVKQILHQFKYGSSYHLWYVYMLIGLYLFIPILGKFVQHATRAELRYFLLVWLVVMIFDQAYISRFKSPLLDVRYFGGYAGYLVLGHYLATTPIEHRRRRGLLLSFVFMVLLIAGGSYLLTVNHAGTITLFYEPLGPFAVCEASALFLFVRLGTAELPLFLQRFRDFTGRYAYGIYLAHALFLYLLDGWLNISYKLCFPLISIPLTVLICFTLSLICTWLLNKIPLIGKYISG
jgi:surface polysaccharide O-acyltransferase-like enzyme